MRLIQRIMNIRFCEVFSYLNWRDLDRFITDSTKWKSISRAFGGDEWKDVDQIANPQKSYFMLNTYKNALKNKAGSKYVLHFAMCDQNDRPLYWLFFCTNNLRGLEEMKKSMCIVDSTGGFRFSDKYNSSELHLFKNEDVEVLAQDIFSKFQGGKTTVLKIKEFVLTETPYYLFKKSLRRLEEKGKIKAINPKTKRPKGTFSDENMIIEFISTPT